MQALIVNFTDIDVQTQKGFESAFRAEGSVFSPISEGDVWLRESHPGLSGLALHRKKSAVVIFVDEIQQNSSLMYHVTEHAGAEPESMIKKVHVQSPLYAWQFTDQSIHLAPLPAEIPVFFIQWIPGALGEALRAHDQVYINHNFPDSDLLLTGSDFEKESLSRFHLAAGMSSLARVLNHSGSLSKISQAGGAVVNLDLPFVRAGFVQVAVRA